MIWMAALKLFHMLSSGGGAKRSCFLMLGCLILVESDVGERVRPSVFKEKEENKEIMRVIRPSLFQLPGI